MQEHTYTPQPIDTGDVVLSDELNALAQRLAKNVHDVWAAGRIAEGWRCGPRRDDAAKTTPLLVPYEELPASEQAYDLNTAMQTLRLVIKLGYSITPPQGPGGPQQRP